MVLIFNNYLSIPDYIKIRYLEKDKCPRLMNAVLVMGNLILISSLEAKQRLQMCVCECVCVRARVCTHAYLCGERQRENEL